MSGTTNPIPNGKREADFALPAAAAAPAAVQELPSSSKDQIEQIFALIGRGEVDTSIEQAMALPNEVLKSLTLLGLIRELNGRKMSDRAIQVSNEIPLEPEKSIALRDISRVIASNGEVDRSIDVAETIQEIEEKCTALLDISKKLTADGLTGRAEKIIRRVILLSHLIYQEDSKFLALRQVVTAFQILTDKLTAENQLEKALEITCTTTNIQKVFRHKINDFIYPRGSSDLLEIPTNATIMNYSNLIDSLLSVGEVERARKIAPLAEALCRDSSDPSQGWIALMFQKLVSAYLCRGDVAKARKMANYIPTWSRGIDSKMKDKSLGEIGRCRIAYGEVDQILERAQIYLESTHREASFSILVELVRFGFYEKAVDFARTHCRPFDKQWALQKIEKAKHLLSAFDSSYMYRIDLHQDTPIILARLGKFDQAMDAARKIASGRVFPDSDFLKFRAMKGIIFELVKMGNFDRALLYSEEIGNAEEKDLSRKTIACGLAAADQIVRAREVAGTITDQEMQRATLELMPITPGAADEALDERQRV